MPSWSHKIPALGLYLMVLWSYIVHLSHVQVITGSRIIIVNFFRIFKSKLLATTMSSLCRNFTERLFSCMCMTGRLSLTELVYFVVISCLHNVRLPWHIKRIITPMTLSPFFCRPRPTWRSTGTPTGIGEKCLRTVAWLRHRGFSLKAVAHSKIKLKQYKTLTEQPEAVLG